MPRFGVAIWLLLVAGAGGCWRSGESTASPFQVVRVSPATGADAEPLLLNDSVTIYFSADVRPISVTPDTVSVFDQDGHLVRGQLDVGGNWVRFTPEPPLLATLTDGSFRPGELYRLVVAGYPRADTVQDRSGRLVEARREFEFRTAPAGPVQTANGLLPAPLRPPGFELPLLMCTAESARQLPADAPTMRLHFTAPILPSTARPEAFEIHLHRHRHRLVARRARILVSPLDQVPGSTIELDLGTTPRVVGGEAPTPLQVGDLLSVSLVGGDDALRDLAGREALPSGPQWWVVSPGASVSILSWPVEDGDVTGDQTLLPGFEATLGLVRAKVRREAGDGSLGVFRPRRDVVLRPGQPLDRGDGVLVQSDGLRFPFLAVDVPEGVRVRVEGDGVQILACGGIRVAGVLELEGGSVPLPEVLPHGIPVGELLDQAPAALVAAGDVFIEGRVVTALELPPDRTALTVACAGYIHLNGELPYNTMLAVEAPASATRPARRVLGARGQSFPRSVTFDYGLPERAAFGCVACTPWSQMPADRDGGMLRVDGLSPGLQLAWQTVAADPLDPSRPDRRVDRRSRPRTALPGEWIPVEPGGFLRFQLTAELSAGNALPQLQAIRLTDR